MADVYNYIVPSGVITTDTETIQTEVNSEYQLAFGADLIVTPDNPQGVLITGEVASRTAVADNNVALANQINPNLSGGVYLDAIGSLTGIERNANTFTIVSCTVTGVPGTIIPISSQAVDTNGNLFQSQNAVALSLSGIATVNFVALVAGAITVAIGALNTIVSTVLGWETITNVAVQTSVGTVTQSDSSFRAYRRLTIGIQGTSLPQATIGALYAVPGVTSVFYQENIAGTTQTIDGVSMISHSIYAVVTGGSDLAVANALLSKKSGGAGYNNGGSMTPKSVTVTVPFSGQIMDILFDRPDPIAINVIVNVKANSALSDPVAAVKQAIADYQAGALTNGEAGLGNGDDVSAFELAGAISYENPTLFITSILIAYAPTTPTVSTTLAIDVFQQASIAPSAIVVNIS